MLSRAVDMETFDGNLIDFITAMSFGIDFKFGLVEIGDMSPTIKRSTYSGCKSEIRFGYCTLLGNECLGYVFEGAVHHRPASHRMP